MKEDKNNKSKFNPYWVYGIIITVLLAMSMFGGDNNWQSLGKTNISDFERFLNDGDKVKITLRFKGREMAFHQRGLEVLKKLESAIEPVAKIEQVPKLEGKQMIMVVAPR